MKALLHAFLRRVAVPGCGSPSAPWPGRNGRGTVAGRGGEKGGQGRHLRIARVGIMDEVEKAFTKKYGIPIEYFRAASNKTLDRVLTEARVGRRCPTWW